MVSCVHDFDLLLSYCMISIEISLDVFLPSPDDLLVNLQESKEVRKL